MVDVAESFGVETVADSDSDGLGFFVVENERGVEPFGVSKVLSFAAKGLPDGPKTVDVGVVGEENGVSGGGVEVSHVLEVGFVVVAAPYVNRTVRNILH